MYIIYNNQTLNDSLIVSFNNQLVTEQQNINDDVVLLKAHNELVGINIFHASQYFSELVEGFLEPAEQFIDELQKITNLSFNTENIQYFKVGQIISFEPIPNTHLNVCQVSVDEQTLQIVCGAKNVRQGMLTVVAQINQMMPNGMYIVASKLMGVTSSGMLCSQKELRVEGFNDEGIIDLDPQTYHVNDICHFVYANMKEKTHA
ncbi:DUF4479 and tRNA-binding domain-containing protein [Ureaplasma miroungigenitalium]|uniref:DUF4479 and tRNA-binding domain-containing protein n=1 Tax=Ureaplasma miroungigenitalium TaxID=1042321 RepID=A0ABT3BNR8_9BACT|nr:DUF4479 and tRNA-binding domain-containing protein [Ureaplasma miroungigenitalium]MCV3728652.1 DUF4479 and tRNA-binding domain-containing protein [Ureaplasma miroungigenitalium]